MQAKVDERREAWNRCARANAFHYVDSSRLRWDEQDFFERGRMDVERFTSGLKLNSEGRMLEIGCGVGRMTRSFSSQFSKVYGVDISEEMIEKAKRLNSDKPNIEFVANSGKDLSAFEDSFFDFCFSFIVFLHIPSEEIIRSYFMEIARVLKPGGVFKIQVDGRTKRNLFYQKSLHNFLVQKGLAKYLYRLNHDSTASAGFPGVWLGEGRVREMLRGTQLDINEIEGQNTMMMWVTGSKKSS